MRASTLAADTMSPFHYAHGLYLPGPEPKRPRALDLFAGCGGFSLGFHQAGWHVIAALEFDYTAAMTYLCNLARPGVQIHFDTDARRNGFEKALEKEWKRQKRGGPEVVPMVAGSGWISNQPESEPGCEHFWIADVRTISGAEVLETLGMVKGELDAIIGGPPCQGYSTAGKQNVMDPRNSLVFEFARLVCEMKPKTMVFENVPGILSMVTPEGVSVVDELARILEAGEYTSHQAFTRAMASHPDARAVARSGGRDRSQRKPKPEPQLELAV